MYQSKLDQVRTLIDDYNVSNVNPSGVVTPAISPDTFFQKLQKMGGTTDGALRACTWEDLQDLGLPKLLARQAANIFRAKPVDIESESPKFVSDKKANRMSIRELFQSYDPTDNNTVWKRLRELSNGVRCVVFNSDNSVNAEASTQCLTEVRDGFPERETFTVDGVPQAVHRIGDRPYQTADENPLYPGRLLRPDGTCDQTLRSWAGVSHTVRVLIYLAVTKTGEIKVNSLDQAHTVLDFVMAAHDVEKTVRTRYAKASIYYDGLVKQGNVPSLKLPLTRDRTVIGGEEFPNKKQDPFFGPHKKF